MSIFGTAKIFSKYRLKQKTSSDLEFDEASPFAGGESGKIFQSGEHINRSASIMSFLAFGLVGILLAQTFKLQIIDRQKFAALAENNRIKEITEVADRGVIYDRNGNVLAKNNAIFDLVAIPQELPKEEEKLKILAREIASIAGKSESDILSSLFKVNRSTFHSELILENINISQAIAFETKNEKLQGIQVRDNSVRSYPDAEYFSGFIGYTGRISPNELKTDEQYDPTDFTGKAGLEYVYEKEMRGEKGIEKAEVDAMGKIILTIDKKNTKSGNNLILSVDGALQKKLQDSLNDQIKKIYGANAGGKGAAAVALDPRSGKVLAMVSLPAYDNNIFVNPGFGKERLRIMNDQSFPMLNRVISGLYPPGSTIKPVMAAAALSEGIVNENTTINDGGAISVVYRGLVTYFRGWNPAGLGPMNVISALAMSSDIYFYTVGGGYGNFIGLGADKIGEYFKKFNLGKKLGIDLPSEASGFVPNKDWKMEKESAPWTIGNTYHLSIGQGYLLATPLQVASWTSVFANGGTLYKPEIVDKIADGDTNDILKEIKPEAINSNIVDKKYINLARRGMREVVVNGTAGSLREVPVPVAGKTGTAQFGSDGKTHSWFTSFAPYDNPEIVLTILIEGGGEGSSTAVPIAKEVLNWYFGGRKDEKQSELIL